MMHFIMKFFCTTFLFYICKWIYQSNFFKKTMRFFKRRIQKQRIPKSIQFITAMTLMFIGARIDIAIAGIDHFLFIPYGVSSTKVIPLFTPNDPNPNTPSSSRGSTNRGDLSSNHGNYPSPNRKTSDSKRNHNQNNQNNQKQSKSQSQFGVNGDHNATNQKIENNQNQTDQSTKTGGRLHWMKKYKQYLLVDFNQTEMIVNGVRVLKRKDDKGTQYYTVEDKEDGHVIVDIFNYQQRKQDKYLRCEEGHVFLLAPSMTMPECYEIHADWNAGTRTFLEFGEYNAAQTKGEEALFEGIDDMLLNVRDKLRDTEETVLFNTFPKRQESYEGTCSCGM